MIGKNVDVESVDRWGRTSLHSAAWKKNFALVNFFLENGANIDAKDNEGLSPLHFAARSFAEGNSFESGNLSNLRG